MVQKAEESKPAAKANGAPAKKLDFLRQLFERDIWEYGVGDDPSFKGQLVALLRILSISWKGLFENRILSRAAALSYSSLLALGPLVAVAVMLSSSLVQSDAEVQIKRALLFIAPSLQEMVTIKEEASSEAAEISTALDTLIGQIVEGAETLIGKINRTGSKAFGIMGALIFVWVIIQLLTSVETTLNQIWGVHQGRPWSQRIVFYWTFISLGTLLGLGSTALLSASNLASLFDWVPFGSDLTSLVLKISPYLSFFMLVLLLALFYRFFPNTSVAIKPALVGSMITASLLLINNYLSILYVHRVISIQSLYGSVGIVPVMMIGLYFFWVLILLGGQFTYAVQNVSLLANQSAWLRISPAVREMVTLSAFLHVARRFHDCEPAPTMNEMSQRLHIPTNILNESLELLEELDWITRIAGEDRREDKGEVAYRPGKPLKFYNLSRFRTAIENSGQSQIIRSLVKADPLLKAYLEAFQWHEKDPFCQTDLQSLLGSPEAASAQP